MIRRHSAKHETRGLKLTAREWVAYLHEGGTCLLDDIRRAPQEKSRLPRGVEHWSVLPNLNFGYRLSGGRNGGQTEETGGWGLGESI